MALTYSFPYLEPVCCSMSSSNCCFFTCIQISQEAGQVVWYSHLFQNFPQFVSIHTVKGFGIVNNAERDIFLEFSWFFDKFTYYFSNLMPYFMLFSYWNDLKKNVYFCYWLYQSLWLCESQRTVENSSRDGNTRPPDLPLEKPICRSGSNS